MRLMQKSPAFMCGRAIKPVRPPSGTKELLKAKSSDQVTCDGSDDPSPQGFGKVSEPRSGVELTLATASDDPSPQGARKNV